MRKNGYEGSKHKKGFLAKVISSLTIAIKFEFEFLYPK